MKENMYSHDRTLDDLNNEMKCPRRSKKESSLLQTGCLTHYLKHHYTFLKGAISPFLSDKITIPAKSHLIAVPSIHKHLLK